MDIPRPKASFARRRRLVLAGGGIALFVGAISVFLANLKPPAPTVERSLVWIDTVKQGPMVRQVRGQGTLVPIDLRWLASRTSGRVEEIILHPGAIVEPDSVIIELSNPDVEQAAINAALNLTAAEAELEALVAQVDRGLLEMEANAANVKADYERARLQAEVDESLFKDGLIAAVVLKQSRVAAQTTAARWEIEQKRLDLSQRTRSAQIAPKKAELARLQAQAELARRDADALRVRAGVAGVLQVLPLEVGQQISPGTNLARIADPSKLKAEIRVPETLAKDILIGQAATVDVHDGLVAGRVARIDPAVRNGTVLVDIALSDKPPKGARPDLSVEGTIELERLQNVVYVGRPAYGQERSTLGVFKLDADDRVANRIPVKFGRCSVNTIEVVAGLQPGDRVILSELSTQENIDRIRIN